jgi:hypothetical protein
VILLLLALLLTQGGARPLKPIRPSATPVELNQNSQAILVTFDELNANPHAFRDQRIHVTGGYTPLPKPDCPNYKGVVIRWALVSNSLQLNGYGFEDVLQMLPADTMLTVEGIWRLFEGTAGCGKGAPRETIWYLQVERILQPNPLFGLGPVLSEDTSGTLNVPTPEAPTPSTAEGTAVPELTPSGTPTITGTPTIVLTVSLTPSPSATLTLTPDGLTLTPSSSTVTSTPNPLASPTATGTIPSTAPATPQTTPGAPTPTVPGLGTSTPGPSPTPGGGYPGPGITPTPTTSGPYP